MNRVPRLLTVAAAAALVLVATSGCVGPAPAPTPTVAPSPTSTATPSPTPTPTASNPTAGATPYRADDITTWTIGFSGIGPIVLGEPLDQVDAAIPSAVDSCRPGANGYFGFAVAGIAADESAPVTMALTTRSADGPTGRPSTAEGITIGSTVDELKAAYPGIEAYETLSGDVSHRLTDGTTWIHFDDYGTGVISAITVITSDQTPKEYCG